MWVLESRIWNKRIKTPRFRRKASWELMVVNEKSTSSYPTSILYKNSPDKQFHFFTWHVFCWRNESHCKVKSCQKNAIFLYSSADYLLTIKYNGLCLTRGVGATLSPEKVKAHGGDYLLCAGRLRPFAVVICVPTLSLSIVWAHDHLTP